MQENCQLSFCRQDEMMPVTLKLLHVAHATLKWGSQADKRISSHSEMI